MVYQSKWQNFKVFLAFISNGTPVIRWYVNLCQQEKTNHEIRRTGNVATLPIWLIFNRKLSCYVTYLVDLSQETKLLRYLSGWDVTELLRYLFGWSTLWTDPGTCVRLESNQVCGFLYWISPPAQTDISDQTVPLFPWRNEYPTRKQNAQTRDIIKKK